MGVWLERVRWVVRGKSVLCWAFSRFRGVENVVDVMIVKFVKCPQSVERGHEQLIVLSDGWRCPARLPSTYTVKRFLTFDITFLPKGELSHSGFTLDRRITCCGVSALAVFRR